jgi:glycolate oxidase
VLGIVEPGITDADLDDALAAPGADDAEAELLWTIRRSMHPAMEAMGTTLIEDVSVPRSALPAMFDEIARIERAYDLVIPTVCHAGDGNLHPNFVFDGERFEIVWRAADELFRAALRLGGTLTGEHGVGVLKRRWLVDELGEDQWQLQRQITRVFDPRHPESGQGLHRLSGTAQTAGG